MNRAPTLLFFIAILIPAFAGEESKSYGEGITLKKTTKVSTILETPKEYEGQRVRIEGRIVDVCAKRGCWMELASDKDFQTVIIKVQDGEIVFPMSAKGKSAIAEGLVYKIELSPEDALGYLQHKAEEQGKKFNPKKAENGLTIYQIEGKGVEIK